MIGLFAINLILLYVLLFCITFKRSLVYLIIGILISTIIITLIIIIFSFRKINGDMDIKKLRSINKGVFMYKILLVPFNIVYFIYGLIIVWFTFIPYGNFHVSLPIITWMGLYAYIILLSSSIPSIRLINIIYKNNIISKSIKYLMILF